MKKHLQLLLLVVAFLLPLATRAQVVVTASSPFLETFEELSGTRAAWTQNIISGSTQWSYGAGAHSSSPVHNAYAGTTNARFTHSVSGSQAMLVSPVLDLSSLSAATLVFYYVNPSWGGDIDELAVYYRTDTTADWTPLVSYDQATAQWTEVELAIPTVSSTVQVAFEGIDNYGYGIGLDNVTVMAPPTCIKPNNFQVTDVTASSISLGWIGVGDATSWVVEYDSVPVVSGVSPYETANTNSITISDLEPNTAYYFSIYTDCGAGDTSQHITISGRTSATAVQLPFSDDFENGMNFVNVSGSFPDTWCVGEDQNNGGSHALYVSTNSGQTAGYSTSTAKYIYAVLPFEAAEDGSYAVSYDWKANGESTWDYLRAFIVPASVTIEASTNAPNGTSSTSTFNTEDVPGWISLGYKHNLSTSWQNDVQVFTLTQGNYQLVFLWCNDGGGGSGIAGCIDNVELRQLSCAQPTNLVVSALPESVTFSWTPGGSEQEWRIVLGEEEYITNDTTYTIEDLAPNTDYMVSVFSICGDGDTSFATTASFRTPCQAIDSLPFSYGFEGLGTSSSSPFTSCWYKGTNYSTAYPYGSSTAHTGSRSLYWYTYSNYCYVALPLFEEPVNNLQVTFWLKRSSSTYPGNMIVGVMTNPADINSFVPVTTVSPVAGSISWTQFDVPLASYQGVNGHIAFKMVSQNQTDYLYLDDITVDLMPTCPRVTDLVASDVTSDAVTLSWTSNGEESQWILSYDETEEIVEDTTYTVEDLTPNTPYTFTVRAYCSDDDTSAATSISLRTSCVIVEEFPWTENFDSYSANATVPCWDNTASSTGSVISNPSYVWGVYSQGGNKMLRMYNYMVSAGTTYMTSPTLAIPDGANYELSFRYSHLASSGPLTVSVITPDSTVQLGSFSNTTGTYDYTNPGEFQDAVFPLTNFAGQNIQIQFFNQANYGSGAIYIDDVTVQEALNCPRVSNLAVTFTHGDTVSLEWPDNGEAAFQIAYGPTGFSLDTVETNIVSVYDTTYTFVGLPLGVNYQFYVRTDCGSEQGAWRGPVSAMTGYFHTMQSGLDTLSDACGYIITDNGGISGSYSDNFDGTLVLLPGGDGQTLIVSGSSYTEGSYDYLTIYDGIGTTGTVLFCDNTSGVSTTLPIGPFTSDEGAITIKFHSDGSTQYDGFQLAVQCVAMSSCIRPTDVTLNSVDDQSATISWNERGEATSWNVTYGPAGFNPGDTSGVTVTALAQPFTISGLLPNTPYDVYVSSDCGTETSLPTGTSFRTACSAIDSLPYFYGFEDATTSAPTGEISPCWNRMSSYSNGYPYPYDEGCNSDYSMYFYSYSAHNCLVLPLFTEDLTALQVKFNLKRATSYSSASYNYGLKVGIMTDPNDMGTFTEVGSAVASSYDDWDSATIYLANYVGTGRYIAFMDASTSAQYYNYVLLDNVTVDYAPECGPVTDLAVTAGVTSALVSWTPSTVGQYDGATVEYKAAADAEYTTLTTAGNVIALTGLTANTNYTVRVINNCMDGDGFAVSANFHTSDFGCLEADTTLTVADTVGNGYSDDEYLPSFSNYNYSLSEQIYLASELGGMGDITGLKFYSATASSQPTRNLSFYVAHTSESSVENWINPTARQLVFSGNVTFTDGGWIDIPFTSTFNYDGSSNLLLIVEDLTGTYNYGNAAATHDLPDNRHSRCAYSDGGPQTLPAPTGSVAILTDRMNIIFRGHGCGLASTCATPIVTASNITPYSADLIWAPGNNETSWIVEYQLTGSANWTSLGVVNTPTIALTGLNQGTNYTARVINPACTDSLTGYVTFATECAKISVLPFTENFNTWGNNVVPNCWSNNGSYSSYGTTSSTYNHSGATGASIYTYSSSSANNTTYTILPEIETSLYNVRDLQIAFFAYKPHYDYDTYQTNYAIGVMTNPNNPNSFRPLDTVSVSSEDTWEIFEVPLSNYNRTNDTGAYIAIKSCYISNYGYGYIDDINVEVIPTCPRPNNLTAGNATPNSVDFSWNERGGASQWIVEYGPRGFELGTGTRVTVNSNPATITNLPSSYVGEYYVRSVCGAGDTGNYSYVPCAFSTTQVPATLPYVYDFENAAEWANWQIHSNGTTNWARGTADASDGQYSMYVSTDNGATVGDGGHTATVKASAYRDIDFGAIDSSYTFTFKAKCGGTTTAAYDGMMVFLVDPSVPVEDQGTSILNSPWGDINELYRIATVRLDTTWQTYSASFDTIHGVKRVAFYYFSQNTASSYPFIGGPAEVDSITIDYSSCPRPVALDTVSVSAHGASFTWQGPANANYLFVYREYPNGRTLDTLYTNTNSITINGLPAATTYICAVQKLCGGADSSLLSDAITFTTKCDVINASEIYTEDFEGYSDASYSEEGDAPNCWVVYSNGTDVAYTPHVTNYDYSTSYCYPHSGVGALTLTSGSASYGDTKIAALPVFAEPLNSLTMKFYYRMESSSYGTLTVGYVTDDNDLVGSFVPVRNISSTTTITLDSVTFDSISATGRIAFKWVYNTSYYSCGIDDIEVTSSTVVPVCHAPEIASLTNDYQSATLTWSGNGTNYEVAIRPATEASYPAPTAVTTTSYTFNGLTPATTYYVQVRQDCTADTLGYSDWVERSFTTDSLPCFTPTNVSYNNVTFNTAEIAWSTTGEETAWEIHVFNTTFDHFYEVTTNPATADGLTAGTSYSAAVRALCGSNHNIFGEWSDTIQFTTDICDPVSNVHATANGLSISLTWTAGENNCGNFEVEYGEHGFGQGEGTTVTVNGTSKTFTGLYEETTYDFYVRAVCAEGLTSAWSSVASATTGQATGDECYAPTDVNATADGTSITFTWTAATGNTAEFEVEYGQAGFAHGQGTTAQVGPEGFTANNLEANTTYDFYVRAICQTGNYSDWSDKASATTGIIGIYDVEGNFNCNIFPNPATDETTISVSGVNGKVTIAVVDMNGRTVSSETLDCSADCVKKMNVSGLTQGAYFVRIYGENVNSVKKLIVR